MDKSALKNYAPQARRDFIEAVTSRAASYGLKADGNHAPVKLQGDVALIEGRPYPKKIAEQRAKLEALIAHDGFAQTMEALAYTWFNRFVAIRYMELHGYLEHGYRVLSNTGDKSSPEILEHAEHVDLPGLDTKQVIALKIDGSKDAQLYRMLLIAQCNALHTAMPFLFEKIDDETELVLPDNLLHSDSLIRKLLNSSDEKDWQDVEVLGWIYQFYISEKKDTVMGRKSAVPTDDIPAVTQLFTPHWIVRYLVENSLGRLWLLNRPSSTLREHMPYYVEGDPETQFLKISKPEDIRLLDPACGSGHMLTYAFDLLCRIYEEEGYAAAEIPALILNHNLHGLEICPRAAQLAEMALVFKARAKSRRFLQASHLVRPNILAVNNITFAENELREYIAALELGDLFNEPVLKLLHQFENATTFGSLIQPCLDEPQIALIRHAIEAKKLGGQLFLRDTHAKILRVLEQAEALTQRYHVVVANPPYMGSRQLNNFLKSFALTVFSDSKSDLFGMFIERGFDLVKETGFSAMVTMHTWMFLASFEELREKLLNERTIKCMCHMDNMVMGIAFGTAAVIWQSAPSKLQKGYYCRVEYSDLNDLKIPREFPPKNNRNALAYSRSGTRYFRSGADDFKKIPGSPIAYWVSDSIRSLFVEKRIYDLSISDGQNKTANNDVFVRTHWEVARNSVGRGKKWLAYAKGGPYRRWYGNMDAVVDWSENARKHYRADSSCRIVPEYLWYRQGITWSRVGNGSFSFRLLPADSTFDMVGSSIFIKDDHDLNLLLGLLNTPVADIILELLNPSVDLQVRDVRNIPVATKFDRFTVEKNVRTILELSRFDWNNFETSWDFRDQPLLRQVLKGATLEASWRNWQAQCNTAIHRMQELETANNRLFIAAYGLIDELKPEVPEDQITLARADARKDLAAFLSYSIGCMMGRYSLDQPGVILANAHDTVEEYRLRISQHTDPLDIERAISHPETVAFVENACVKCFACGTSSPLNQSRFVLSGENKEGTIRGRPLIYCSECADGKQKTYVTWQQPLEDFTVRQALDQKWCAPETLKIFLELANCFGHRRPAETSDITFNPDDDGIIPILDGEWFDDDIVARVREFLCVTFGEKTLLENLAFLEASLGKELRKYFITDFYKDHLQTYKKRPIYWMFSSGKQRAFQCLVYLHRYNEGTLARMRTEYVIPLMSRIDARIEQLKEAIAGASTTAQRKKFQKENDDLKKQQPELLAFDEKLKHYADQRIKLDLDDGVKVNYGKFGDLLAEVKAITGGDDE